MEESAVNECVGWSQQFSTLIAVCEKAAELSVRQPMPYIMVLLPVVLFRDFRFATLVLEQFLELKRCPKLAYLHRRLHPHRW